jgi:hypothetical protein
MSCTATPRQRHKVPESSKPCIQTQTTASHTGASQQQDSRHLVAPIGHWRYECHQHVNPQALQQDYLCPYTVCTCNGGFCRCVCAAGEKSVQIPPVYRLCEVEDARKLDIQSSVLLHRPASHLDQHRKPLVGICVAYTISNKSQ